MRVLVAAGLCFIATGLLSAATDSGLAGAKKKARVIAPKAGIKTPGIQIPFERLKAEAEIPIETPGWITTGETLFVTSQSKDMVVRIEARTSKVVEPILDLKKPCSGSVDRVRIAVDSQLRDADGNEIRYQDQQSNRYVRARRRRCHHSVGRDGRQRLDDHRFEDNFVANRPVAEPSGRRIAAACRIVTACRSVRDRCGLPARPDSHLLRINPETNLVEKRIEVSAGARSVAFGDKSVWVLCEQRRQSGTNRSEDQQSDQDHRSRRARTRAATWPSARVSLGNADWISSDAHRNGD